MAYDLIKISALPAATPDESQEIVVGVGDLAKRINYGDVKADMVGTSPSYTTDTEPYLTRQTAHTGVVGKCALSKLVGGSLGWNQLATNFVNRSQTLGISITADNVNGKITTSGTASATNNLYFMQGLSVITGHKYLVTGSKGKGTLVIPSFTDRVDSGNGMIFSSGSTSTAAQIAYGFTSGQTYSETLYPQFFDLTQMFGSTIADYIYSLEQSSSGSGIAWLSKYIDLGTYHAYDAGSIQSVQATAHVTTGFQQWDEVWSKLTINNTGEAVAGNYVGSVNLIPVIEGATYYLTPPPVTGNKTRWVYAYDGNGNFLKTAFASIGYLTLNGTNSTFTIPQGVRFIRFLLQQEYSTYNHDICLNISKTSGSPKNGDYVPYSGHTYPLGSDTLRGIPQLVSNKLAFDGDEKYPDGTIKRRYGIRAYQSGDVSDGSTMLTDGTNTVYKLTTPTTESSTSYQKVQTIDADGTESFTTSTPVPVGHETQTPDNILAALSWLGE